MLSGVPMVVGVKTVKVLYSKAMNKVSNPDYQRDKQKNYSCCQKRKLSEKLLRL